MKTCPRCGYLNDDRANFCVMCGYNFNRGNFKKKIILPTVLAVIAIVALVLAMPTISAMLNSPQVVIFSPSKASQIFGGSWTVVENETYLKVYPTENITIYYANGTKVEIPYYHSVKSVNREVLIGNVSGNRVIMIIQVVKFANNTLVLNKMPSWMSEFGFEWNNFNVSFKVTTYQGYHIYYFASTFPHPYTKFLAVKEGEVIQVTLHGYAASLNQMEQVLSQLK